MSASDPFAAAELGQALANRLLARLGPGHAKDPALQAFAAQAAEDVVPAELPEFDLDDLAVNLASFWTFAEKRRGLSPILRVVRAERAEQATSRLDLDRLEIV